MPVININVVPFEKKRGVGTSLKKNLSLKSNIHPIMCVLKVKREIFKVIGVFCFCLNGFSIFIYEVVLSSDKNTLLVKY